MTTAETLSSVDKATETPPPMSTHQLALYKRIQAFSFDSEDDDLPFSSRLARDNGWSLDFALEVIEEYRRFAFLAIAADHPVTPSDQVDQIWHLHLTYTRSYWDDFCANALKAPLHHEPTKGGNKEAQKFGEWYNQTLASYEQFFDETPPKQVWPTAEDRFGRDSHFVRVNSQQKWVIPKPPISREVVGALLAVAIAVAVYHYIETVDSHIAPVGIAVLLGLCATAGFSVIQLIAKLLDVLNRPAPFAISGDGGCGFSDNIGCGGCGGGGCGG